MILISTLRKMIAKNPEARVIRVTVKPYTANLGSAVVDIPGSVDYFATDRQAGEAFVRNAEQIRGLGANPAELNRMEDVPANEAAKAQGFDFLKGA